jgi:hypothetical protein
MVDGNSEGSGFVCIDVVFFSQWYPGIFYYLLWSNSMLKLDSWLICVARCQCTWPNNSRLKWPLWDSLSHLVSSFLVNNIIYIIE